MNLLEMFKQLTLEEQIEFINLIIDAINSCFTNREPTNKYEASYKIGRIKID